MEWTIVRLKILVVDDAQDIWELLEILLQGKDLRWPWPAAARKL